MWGLTVRATFSHGSCGNFYEGEQEQCPRVPAGALCGGLRISQWHKHCWSLLASLWLEPLVSYVKNVFLVPPPTPAYLLHLHIYNRVPFLLQLAMSGASLSSMSSFVHGWGNITHFSLGAVHFADSTETWRVHITLLMWPPQPETKLNWPYNLVCIGKILLLEQHIHDHWLICSLDVVTVIWVPTG